ncbi:hypothetical protein [Candidatus Symbiopectobacterium sp. NZEC151]|uniref:hypothetical protein n=1 Tax=Candidatus Symbiopectobacterium sp. NZEC151 TaxID=2820470 RepID=UPI0022268D31|nr:hypothetical protein [Candidatus Symbiopectobacterium sp. NZEC151]MCW2474433.1 hypothetical protein [Candidatus Symbiopectobacterium sp. NZEC151]
MTIAQQLEQKGMEIGFRRGFRTGFEIGYELGRLAVILKVVRNMRQNGMDDATVMKMTGLSEDELAQICH